MDYNVSFPGLGLEFTVNPVAFTIGNYPVYWYGIIIASGLLLAVLYAYVSSKRYNVDGNKLINCILVGIITGIIGARLYYCFFEWDYYGKNPIEILYINNGGLAIYMNRWFDVGETCIFTLPRIGTAAAGVPEHEVAGVICWMREVPKGGSFRYVAGIQLRFADPEEKAAMQNYVAYVKKRYRL